MINCYNFLKKPLSPIELLSSSMLNRQAKKDQELHAIKYKDVMEELKTINSSSIDHERNIKRLVKYASCNPNLSEIEKRTEIKACIRTIEPESNKIDPFITEAIETVDKLNLLKARTFSSTLKESADYFKEIIRLKGATGRNTLKEILVENRVNPVSSTSIVTNVVTENLKQYTCTEDLPHFVHLANMTTTSETLVLLCMHGDVICTIGAKVVFAVTVSLYNEGHFKQVLADTIYDLNFRTLKNTAYSCVTSRGFLFSTGILLFSTFTGYTPINMVQSFSGLLKESVIPVAKSSISQAIEVYQLDTEKYRIESVKEIYSFISKAGFTVGKLFSAFPQGFARGVIDNQVEIIQKVKEATDSCKN